MEPDLEEAHLISVPFKLPSYPKGVDDNRLWGWGAKFP